MASDLKIFKADGVWLKNIQGGWRNTYEYSRRMAYDLKILRRMAYDLKIFKADAHDLKILRRMAYDFKILSRMAYN